MSVNATWVADREGRDNTKIVRIGDDNYGEVLQTTFLSNDPATNLDYFEAVSPRGLSTFGLTQLAGSGNPFQLVYLGVAERVSGNPSPPPPDNGPSPMDETGGGAIRDRREGPGCRCAGCQAGGAPASAPVTVTLPTNTQGVISYVSQVQAPDGHATITLAEGVLARDSAGNHLTSITIGPATAPDMPGSVPQS